MQLLVSSAEVVRFHVDHVEEERLLVYLIS